MSPEEKLIELLMTRLQTLGLKSALRTITPDNPSESYPAVVAFYNTTTYVNGQKSSGVQKVGNVFLITERPQICVIVFGNNQPEALDAYNTVIGSDVLPGLCGFMPVIDGVQTMHPLRPTGNTEPFEESGAQCIASYWELEWQRVAKAS